MRCPLARANAPRPSGIRAELNAQPIRLLVRDRSLARAAGTEQRSLGFYVHRQQPNRAQMTKYLLAAVAATILISGVASAQVYAPSPPAPPGAVVVPAPPPPPVAVP